MVLISFSWDDGAAEDLRLMDLALKYSIPGIFFIPAENEERDVITPNDIRKISDTSFEIGAHTYSHKYLTDISLKESKIEIVSGRDYLQQILGKPVDHFCFPGGKYNNDLIEFTKLNFKSARTSDTGAIVRKGSFLIRPAIHFYDRGKISLLYNSLKSNSPVYRTVLKNAFSGGYFDLLKRVIEELNRYESMQRIIIWGHSWEIQNYNLWEHLTDLFQWLKANFPSSMTNYSKLIDK